MLIFCATKKWCQTTACLLAKEMLLERDWAGAAEEEAETKKRLLAIDGDSKLQRHKRTSVFACASHEPLRKSSNGQGRGSKDTTIPERVVRAKVVRSIAVPSKSTILNANRNASGGKAMGEGAGACAGSAVVSSPIHEHTTTGAQAAAAATASVVLARLRDTPVGLDADLAHLASFCAYIFGENQYDGFSHAPCFVIRGRFILRGSSLLIQESETPYKYRIAVRTAPPLISFSVMLLVGSKTWLLLGWSNMGHENMFVGKSGRGFSSFWPGG